MTGHRFRLWLLAAAVGCSAPPASSPLLQARSTASPPAPAPRAALADDCEDRPGEPAPEPLRKPFDGVAKAARCQREVYTIMGGVSHFLGVPCKHCHLEPDYAADTHNKQVANWMARELVPRLQRRVADAGNDRSVWCKDCHASKPKLLGNPRRRDLAIDWMTTHLVEDFETRSAKPPKCKDCHGGDLGSPDFRARVILEGALALPAPTATPAAPAESASPVFAPVPDFGGR